MGRASVRARPRPARDVLVHEEAPDRARGDRRRAAAVSGADDHRFRYPAGIRFRNEDLSNNNLITDDGEIRGRLEAIHAGDQVRVRGLLVDYQMDDWGERWRRTSTERGDDGCEVILVEDFEVLRRGAPRWHRLHRASWWLLAMLPAAGVVLLWLSAPARPPGGTSSAGDRTPAARSIPASRGTRPPR